MPTLNLKKLLAAAALYSAFAVYLYQPYFAHFRTLHYLVVLNAVAASLGCFVLSGRWINGGIACAFAGAMYGFGPFFISFISYHPFAGTLIAALPWLFCPAAFWPGLKQPVSRTVGGWQKAKMLGKKLTTLLLCLLPFLAIVLFFTASTRYGLFAVPKTARLRPADMAGLLAPLAIKPGSFIVGFYHSPVAALVMGLFVFFAVRRAGVLIIFVVGTVLAFCGSIFQVSPVVWAAVPVLCCSIIIGIGMQALASATAKDRRWILACAVIMAVCTLLTGLLGIKKADTYFDAAWMYGLGMLPVLIVFFIASAKLRLRWLRWLILSTGIGLDVFIGAQTLIDSIF